MLPNVKAVGDSYQNKVLGHTKKEKELEQKESSVLSPNVADKEVATLSKTDRLTLSNEATRKTEEKTLTVEEQLSDKAKNYLSKLRKSRKNVDFRISEKGMEEKYLDKTTAKEFTVVLTNEEIEKMATDKAFEKKQLAIIDKTMQEMLKASLGLGEENGSGKTNASDVKDIALRIKEDGSMEILASLEKSSKSLKQTAAEQAKKKETEKAEAKRLEKKRIRFRKPKKSKVQIESAASGFSPDKRFKRDIIVRFAHDTRYEQKRSVLRNAGHFFCNILLQGRVANFIAVPYNFHNLLDFTVRILN